MLTIMLTFVVTISMKVKYHYLLYYRCFANNLAYYHADLFVIVLQNYHYLPLLFPFPLLSFTMFALLPAVSQTPTHPSSPPSTHAHPRSHKSTYRPGASGQRPTPPLEATGGQGKQARHGSDKSRNTAARRAAVSDRPPGRPAASAFDSSAPRCQQSGLYPGDVLSVCPAPAPPSFSLSRSLSRLIFLFLSL